MENEKKITDVQLENVSGGEENDEVIQRLRCPKCGSTNIGRHVEGGMLWGYCCLDCGYEWK